MSKEKKYSLNPEVIMALRHPSVIVKTKALFQFFSQLDVSLFLFWIVVFFSLLSTIFSAYAYQLFIPFLCALISEDYNLDHKVIGLSPLLSVFPLSPKNQMLLLFTLVLIVWFLKNLTGYLSRLNGTYLAKSLDCNLKKAIINRYFIFGKKFHDGRGVGFLNNVLTDFSGNVAHQVFVVQRFFQNIFGAIIYGMIMLSISWQLTLITLLMSPFTFYLAKKIIGKLKLASNEYSSALDVFVCNSFDLLMSLPLIKNVGKEDYEQGRFYTNADKFVETKYKIDKYNCLVDPVKDMSTMILSLIVAVSIVFIGVSDHSPATVSSYIVFFILLSLAFPGISAFADLEIAFASISGQFDVLLDSLELKKEWLVSNGTRLLDRFNNKIEFRDVCFAYGTQDFIKKVSFEINKGETLALVGQAGAGKTTITNLLLRHYELSGGGIYIDGVDTREFDVDSLRMKMSVISQTHYFMDATVRDNLLYAVQNPETIDPKRLEYIVETTGLKELLSRLQDGYKTRVSSRGGSLSGGEQQLISIARAFMRDADIYILDEPTNALDARSFKKAQNAINHLIAGKTTLIIAHHLSTVRRADKIVLIENGEIVETGTIKELLNAKGKFYSYWMEQQEECFLCKL